MAEGKLGLVIFVWSIFVQMMMITMDLILIVMVVMVGMRILTTRTTEVFADWDCTTMMMRRMPI